MDTSAPVWAEAVTSYRGNFCGKNLLFSDSPSPENTRVFQARPSCGGSAHRHHPISDSEGFACFLFVLLGLLFLPASIFFLLVLAFILSVYPVLLFYFPFACRFRPLFSHCSRFFRLFSVFLASFVLCSLSPSSSLSGGIIHRCCEIIGNCVTRIIMSRLSTRGGACSLHQV